jgi:exodeoxyribonuclease V alpha subunit
MSAAVERVRAAPALLDDFNAAGVLAPADVHAACTYGRLCGDADPWVLLAAALAVRAPRLQHVCVDLPHVRGTVTVDDGEPADLDALPWPEPLTAWQARLRASPLVADGRGAPDDRPLRLVGQRLYLDRYWRYEQRVLAALTARAAAPAPGVDERVLAADLERLFGPEATADAQQRAAAAAAVRGRLAVIAGGPGTGKTRTVSRVLALLAGQARAAEAALPRVALAAPTGKAAQRMAEALAGALAELDVDDATRAWLLALDGLTLHRLLRRRPGRRTRFRHDAANPLPHDVVIVDETSMASLALVAKLLDAVRPDARLVLVGDPNQLASVEAGSVLGDVVGPDAGRARGGAPPVPAPTATAHALAARTVVLQRGYRFRAGIAELATAVQAGDPDAVWAVLTAGHADVRWLPAAVDAPDGDEAALGPVRAAVSAVGAELCAAALRGDAPAALAALGGLRLLCAHRRGPFGVARWVPRVERWLADDVPGFDARPAWYVGRPVLVTRNDYQIGVLNGDVGVAVADAGGLAVVFPKGEGVRRLAPTRLEHVETVHAMTIHKAQGSEFDGVVVVLPPPGSPILTRELLYTAVTRARRSLTVVGTEAAVRAAVARRVQRASGLRAALWDGD